MDQDCVNRVNGWSHDYQISPHLTTSHLYMNQDSFVQNSRSCDCQQSSNTLGNQLDMNQKRLNRSTRWDQESSNVPDSHLNMTQFSLNHSDRQLDMNQGIVNCSNRWVQKSLNFNGNQLDTSENSLNCSDRQLSMNPDSNHQNRWSHEYQKSYEVPDVHQYITQNSLNHSYKPSDMSQDSVNRLNRWDQKSLSQSDNQLHDRWDRQIANDSDSLLHMSQERLHRSVRLSEMHQAGVSDSNRWSQGYQKGSNIPDNQLDINQESLNCSNRWSREFQKSPVGLDGHLGMYQEGPKHRDIGLRVNEEDLNTLDTNFELAPVDRFHEYSNNQTSDNTFEHTNTFDFKGNVSKSAKPNKSSNNKLPRLKGGSRKRYMKLISNGIPSNEARILAIQITEHNKLHGDKCGRDPEKKYDSSHSKASNRNNTNFSSQSNRAKKSKMETPRGPGCKLQLPHTSLSSEVTLDEDFQVSGEHNPDNLNVSEFCNRLATKSRYSEQGKVTTYPIDAEYSYNLKHSIKENMDLGFQGEFSREFIKMAVTTVEYPKCMLTTKQLNRIEKEINNLVKIEVHNKPEFSSFTLKQGVVIIACETEYSKKWLERIIPKFSWEALKVSRKKDIFRFYSIVFRIPEDLVNLDNATIFELLDEQNSGLDAKVWIFVSTSPLRTGGRTIRASVKFDSIRFLQSTGLTAFLGLGMVKFTILQRS